MKKTLLIALLLIPFFGFAKTTKPITGFLGIKFGSSRAIVIAAIKARGGILNKNSTEANLAFTNISVGHRKSEFLIVRFVDNKAFEADFTFKPEDDDHVLEYYNSLNSDLTEVYGNGDVIKKIANPYAGEPELTAILLNDADYNTVWESSEKNSLMTKIVKDNDGMDVELTYQDGVLIDLAISRQKTKDKVDY